MKINNFINRKRDQLIVHILHNKIKNKIQSKLRIKEDPHFMLKPKKINQLFKVRKTKKKLQFQIKMLRNQLYIHNREYRQICNQIYIKQLQISEATTK